MTIPLQFASFYDRQEIFMWSNCLTTICLQQSLCLQRSVLGAFSSHLSSKVYSCSVPSVLTCPARCTHVRASLFTQWLVSISNNPLPLSKVSVSHYCTFCALHQYCIQRRTTFSCGRSLDSAWSLMVMSALVLLSLFPCCTTFHSVRL